MSPRNVRVPSDRQIAVGVPPDHVGLPFLENFPPALARLQSVCNKDEQGRMAFVALKAARLKNNN
jgi:hypothetical protein